MRKLQFKCPITHDCRSNPAVQDCCRQVRTVHSKSRSDGVFTGQYHVSASRRIGIDDA